MFETSKRFGMFSRRLPRVGKWSEWKGGSLQDTCSEVSMYFLMQKLQ